MMKKIVILLILFFLVLALGNGESRAADNPGEKLARGVVNVVSAPIEIAKKIDQEWKSKKEQPAALGVFSGFFKGLAATLARMGSGAWDIATFPFKVPNDYDPLVKPEFVLEKEQPQETP